MQVNLNRLCNIFGATDIKISKEFLVLTLTFSTNNLCCFSVALNFTRNVAKAENHQILPPIRKRSVYYCIQLTGNPLI